MENTPTRTREKKLTWVGNAYLHTKVSLQQTTKL